MKWAFFLKPSLHAVDNSFAQGVAPVYYTLKNKKVKCNGVTVFKFSPTMSLNTQYNSRVNI